MAEIADQLTPAEVLRLKQKATPAEVASAESDLNDWASTIVSTDTDLRKQPTKRTSKALLDEDETPTKKSLPPVRGTKPLPASSSSKTAAPVIATKPLVAPVVVPKEKRISGYDFRAWEKFDAEEAAERVEREEEALTEASKVKSKHELDAMRKSREESDARRRATHTAEMDLVLDSLRAVDMSEAQRKHRAEREKQKGNEYFRAGEFEPAYDCYTKSIALDPYNNIVHANRAVVALKLERLESAEDDCTRSLALDRTYVKAWSRRGMAKFKRGKYSEVQSLTISISFNLQDDFLYML